MSGVNEKLINEIVNKHFSLAVGTTSCKDIILSKCPNILKYHKHHHIYKMFTMKLGLVWEDVFCLFGYRKLDKGADTINNEKKIIMELKNSYRTDNSSSKKGNKIKLVNTKKILQLDYELVYGVINDAIPKDYYIDYDGHSIRYITGQKLLKFVLGDEETDVVNYIIHNFNKDIFRFF